jgi:hypothetical protein
LRASIRWQDRGSCRVARGTLVQNRLALLARLVKTERAALNTFEEVTVLKAMTFVAAAGADDPLGSSGCGIT